MKEKSRKRQTNVLFLLRRLHEVSTRKSIYISILVIRLGAPRREQGRCARAQISAHVAHPRDIVIDPVTSISLNTLTLKDQSSRIFQIFSLKLLGWAEMIFFKTGQFYLMDVNGVNVLLFINCFFVGQFLKCQTFKLF